MSAYDPPPRLNHLLARLVDGELPPDEVAELDGWLRGDPQARDHWRWFIAVHGGLEDLFGNGTVQSMPHPSRGMHWVWAAAAAVALTVGGAGWGWWGKGHAEEGRVADEVPAVDRVVLATVTRADGVEWSLREQPAVGLPLSPGRVEVAAGSLTLALVGGQTLAVTGPASIQLVNPLELAVFRGQAAMRTREGQGPFILQVPKGTVVDMGTELALNVTADGTAQVRVFGGMVTACTLDKAGRTRGEMPLFVGQAVLIDNDFKPCAVPPAGFLRIPRQPPPADFTRGLAYSKAVLASAPVAYWSFEQAGSGREVPAEAGGEPLQLHGNARITGADGHRFMMVDDVSQGGYAAPGIGLNGLDTERGLTVECLLYPLDEGYGSVVALELDGPPPPDLLRPVGVLHAPQTFVLERMSRRGMHLGHVHPDFAIRSAFRSPAGFLAGTNCYSRESHLMDRWIHVAATREGSLIRLYIDGELSNETVAELSYHDVRLRPIIGKLQPLATGEQRQWIGGIDEVAVYGRALSAGEIRAHHAAIRQ